MFDLSRIPSVFFEDPFPFYAEFLLHLKREGKKIVESPIIFKSRTKGISKMKIFKTIVDYLVLLKIIFTNRIKS